MMMIMSFRLSLAAAPSATEGDILSALHGNEYLLHNISIAKKNKRLSAVAVVAVLLAVKEEEEEPLRRLAPYSAGLVMRNARRSVVA
jgi:hypothetical protein